MRDEAFAALADPTRRSIFATLARSGPSTATGLASGMSITRQAVAKHLAVLAEAGMATATRSGRETRYEADVGGLADVRDWIIEVEGAWSTRLKFLAESLADRRATGPGEAGDSPDP